MFIWSCKASTLKFFGFILLFGVVLTAVICFVPIESGAVLHESYLDTANINYDDIKDNEGCRTFLAQFGWETESTPHDQAQVTIPQEFDKIFSAYNQMQLAQGLDLTPYRGKKVTRYTYRLQNYPDYEGTVYANVFVWRNRVIGGDICSADVNGFLHGFSSPKK